MLIAAYSGQKTPEAARRWMDGEAILLSDKGRRRSEIQLQRRDESGAMTEESSGGIWTVADRGIAQDRAGGLEREGDTGRFSTELWFLGCEPGGGEGKTNFCRERGRGEYGPNPMGKNKNKIISNFFFFFG